MSKVWILFLILAASLFAFVFGQQVPLSNKIAWAQEIKNHPLKIPVFIGISIIVCFINIPLGVITKVMSGWLFGLANGFFISFFTILFGSWLAFRMARFLGRDFIEKFWGKGLAKLNAQLSKNERLALVQIRIFPFIPLPLANFGLGMSTVSDLKFIIFSGIGMIPATLFYSWVGNELTELTNESLNFRNFTPYYVYIFLALLFSVCLPYLNRHLNKQSSIKKND